MSYKFIAVLQIFLIPQSILGQFNPHYHPNRTGIVHLFEWKWNDIAVECERVLAPNHYAGVQVSPVNENAIIQGRPWFERYQPVSYNLTTRSGTRDEFEKMVRRCNNVGVRVYVDVVFNHMAAGGPVTGTAGSKADPSQRRFPIYGPNDFHPTCAINDYMNAREVRVCELSGLPDLDQSKPTVRKRIINFLNDLVDMGVAGFRVDASKHMFPSDLSFIYHRVHNLRQDFNFPVNARPFIFQEVIDLGGEGVSKWNYVGLGTITEFIYSSIVGLVFQGQQTVKNLEGLGPARTLLPSNRAFVFVDNHDNQRGHGGGGITLTHKKPKEYVSAVAFTLAVNYGIARVMSSYYFNDPSQGPPQDLNGNIIGPSLSLSNETCDNGWVCEHRWNPIANMVKFRVAAKGTQITNWNIFNDHELSFCRGNVGCIAFKTGSGDFDRVIATSLTPGIYCDIISGKKLANKKCSGKQITVDDRGKAKITIRGSDNYAVVAFYVGSKL